MITSSQLRSALIFVGAAGAELRALAPDGEVEWVLGLTPGVHPADQFRQYCHPTDEIELTGSATLRYRGGRVLVQSFGETMFQTGANPDFRPSAYTEAEVRMRKLIKEANNAEKRLRKRQSANASVERMIPESESDLEVIEPEEVEQPQEAEEPQKPVKKAVPADE